MGSVLAPGTMPIELPDDLSLPGLPIPGLQIVAGPGKDLPEAGRALTDDDAAAEQQASADGEAPTDDEVPFAWFALPAAAPADGPAMATVTTKPVVALQPGLPAAPSHEAAPQQESPSALPGEAMPIVDAMTLADADAGARAAPLARKPVERPILVAPRAAVPIDTSEVPAASMPDTAPLAERTAPIERALRSAAQNPLLVGIMPVAVHGVEPDLTEVRAPILGGAIAPALATVTKVVSDTDTIAVLPSEPASATIPAPSAASAPPAGTVPATPAGQPLAPMVAATSQQNAQSTPDAKPAVAPPREAAPATVDVLAPRVQMAVPAAQPVPASAPQTAPLTVASLIAQASVPGVAHPVVSTLHRSFGEIEQAPSMGFAAPGASILQQVAASPGAQHGALDMRRQEWTGKMIEMIEAMRESAPIKETRISLMPDALGKVDIAVRQDGDRVHVHFTTETQAARQILTDAQVRLNEIAEARGIRLGQTSVDAQGAGAGSGQRQNDAPRPHTPSAPASAHAAKDQSNTDERVA